MQRIHDQMVITGIGLVSAVGGNKEEALETMLRNRSGIGPVTRFDTSWASSNLGAEVKGYDPNRFFTPEQQRRYDRCAQYAIIAAQEALGDSGLAREGASSRIGLVLGTCNGGLVSLEEARSTTHLTPDQAMRYLFYYQAEAVAAHFGFTGPVSTIVTACAASGNAIGFACDLIAAGKADCVVAGGSDALAMTVYAGFNSLQALAPKPCSPYSRDYGLSLGEGAAMVVIEPLSRARARGARIYAEVRSYGLSSDAYHITAPEPHGRGIAQAVCAALRTGGVSAEAVEYINTHGTGTQANDAAELRGLSAVFGEKLGDVPLSSSKAYFGHCLGAAAAIELTSALALEEAGRLPATLHFEEARPGCEQAQVIANEARPADVSWFLKNNAAFGGNNVSLLLNRRPSDEPGRSRPNHRVVITGLGFVTPYGYGKRAFADHTLAVGEGALAEQPFSLKAYAPALYERRMNALTQMCIAGADLALQDAKLTVTPELEEHVGLVMACSRGSLASAEKYLQPIFEGDGSAASSIYFPDMVLNATAGRMATKLRLRGYASTLAGGGTCGLMSLFYGSELVRTGRQRYCLAGGGGERSGLSAALNAALDWPTEAPEGSLFVMLETPDSARARGVEPLAEVSGFGIQSSGDTSQPSIEAGKAAVAEALRSAGLEPEAIRSVHLCPTLPEHEPVLAEIAAALFGSDKQVQLPTALRYSDSVSSAYALAAAVSQVSRGPAMVLSLSPFGSFAAVLLSSSPV